MDAGISKRYTTFSGVIDYRHKFNSISGISASFDLFYDESLITKYPESSDRYLYGIHGGYDFMFHDLQSKFILDPILVMIKEKTRYLSRLLFSTISPNG